MFRWRRGERLSPQALATLAAPEQGVEARAARDLGADDPGERPSRPASAPTRTDRGADRSPGGPFHVEHDDRGATGPTDADPREPSADPGALAWGWRRGQQEARPPASNRDEHQAVTVRPVGAAAAEEDQRYDGAPAPRVSAPVPSAVATASPREDLEQARHLATGARQQPPEDAEPWARIAEELRRP